MSWLHVIVVGATGVAAMRAAFEHGDLDEAARAGALAGPAVVEQALGSPDRVTRLAAIAAAPLVEDRAELLDALARVAGAADRRTAVPAAGAARAIARELAGHDRPDDLADDDLATWRRAWAALAMRGDRWIELRILALDTAAALDHAGIGVDLAAALRDPDPAFRRAAATIVPLPAVATSYAALAGAVVRDSDPDVALGAAQSLCLSIDPKAVGSPTPRDSASRIDPTGEPPRPAGKAVGVPTPRDSASRIDPTGEPPRPAGKAVGVPTPRDSASRIDPTGEPPRPAGKAVGVPTPRDSASRIDPADPAARPILDALGAAGLTRLRALVTSDRALPERALRDVARCLAADGSAESAAALRALRSGRGAR